MLRAFGLVALQIAGNAGPAPPPPGPPASEAEAPAQLLDEELILFAVQLDRATLTESLTAYGDPSNPLIALDELARLLALDLEVYPGEGRVTGRLGEEQRALTIDIGAGLARVGGREVKLAPSDIAASPTDIFVRATALEQLLPIEIEADGESLLLKLSATERLPVQINRERAGRIAGLQRGPESSEPVLRIATPYELFTPPAFDVAVETGSDSQSGRLARRYDIRTAGDLLYTGFKGYLGADERGTPSTARFEMSRRSPEGRLLGPIGATYVAGGDVFTPPLPIGPRSAGGRGFSFTTAKLERASVFQRITLRGELPIGFDVELYVNDVLRSGQRSPVEGRYEFIDVPLVQGLNVLRVVTYGPRGERSEQTRVINVGGGQLPQGELSFDFGLVQQDEPILDLGEPITSVAAGGRGKARAIASLAYGLREDVTLLAGAGLYPDAAGAKREVMTLGARGSLFGMSLQGDVARDMEGGLGAAFGLAGQPLGISLVARHSEYAGGFVDETASLFDLSRPLARHSALSVDFTLPRIGGRSIPLSMRVERSGFVDGGQEWAAIGRTSTTIAKTLVSAGIDYQRSERPETTLAHRLTGNVAASRFVDFKWQLRGVIDYDIIPKAELRAVAISADRNFSDRLGVRFGYGRTFGTRADNSLQAAGFLRMPFGDLALSGNYATGTKDWRIGLRLAFGLAFDPGGAGYRMVRPGPASGGSIAFHAFTDANANGIWDPGEAPGSGVALEGLERRLTTGEDGRLFVSGVGESPTATARANIDNIDAFFVSSPPHNIEFSPRAGRVIAIPYPLVPVAEVFARATLEKDGAKVPVSSVRLMLVREGVAPVVAASEYDGSAVFSGVRPGTYRLEIDPAQAARLRMRLKAPVTVEVSDEGMSGEVAAELVFDAPPA